MDINSKTGLDIFVLSGQSNMAGRGGVVSTAGSRAWNHVVPKESHVAKGSVLRLSAELDWAEAKDPLHYDIDLGKVCGVGPGLIFAGTVLRLLKDRNETIPVIGLVPCAIGGTSIREWAKGGRLYNQMITRADFARRGGGNLKALLWYQGESDAETEERAKLYHSRLETFFADVRSDLNEKELPIIQVRITGMTSVLPHLEEVRTAQAAIDIPHVYTVDAWGLDLKRDNLHLTTDSQVKLGVSMAAKYVSEVKGMSVSSPDGHVAA